MTIPYWSIDRTLGAAEVSLREYQVQAVNEIVDQFNAGYTDVLLDAPVGSGKTFIAAAVMMLIRDAKPGAKTMYLAGDKTLQRQYHRDFPSSFLIEGHVNYCPDPDACRNENKRADCPICGDYTDGVVGHLVGAHGLSLKAAKEIAPTNCAYALAKRKAVKHSDVVTNPWYYGLETRYVGHFARRSIAVYDECDNLDGAIDTITGNSVALSVIQAYVNLDPWLTRTGSGGEVVSKRQLDKIERSEWLTILSYASAEAMRRPKGLPLMSPKRESLLIDAAHFQNIYTMIVEGGPRVAVDYSMSDRELQVIKVDPGEYGAEHLWPTTDYRLFMTGSFGNTDTWAKYMGLRDFGVVTVPHTFLAYRRPVYINRIGEFTGTWTARRTDIIDLAQRIKELHRGRTLVLVHSAAQAQVLKELIDYAIIHRRGSEDRNRALAEYLATENALLITTSWRGLDLKDDACRTLIIAKIPWSPKTDLVTKRMNVFHDWREEEALRKITQGLGRGMRGPDDYCYHYILDKLPPKIAANMPTWVTESIQELPTIPA